MKTLTLFMIIAVSCYAVYTASVKKFEYRTRAEQVARIDSEANRIVDTVINLLRIYVDNHSLEPLSLPDLTENFSVEIIFTTVDGVLYLNNGWLRDLVSLIRSEEATVGYYNDQVHINTNVRFNVLHLDYNYRVVVLGMEPSGQLKGTADGIRLNVDLTANLDTYRTTLGSLRVVDAAKINIEVDGGGIEDEIINAIAGIVEPYFEKDILAFVEEKMRSTLDAALVDFDIREILG